MAKKKTPAKKATPKKTAAKKAVKHNPKAAPKHNTTPAAAPPKKKALNKGLKRYNAIQKALSSYAKENNLKFGKTFHSIAGGINARVNTYEPKFIVQNFEQIYLDYMASIGQGPTPAPGEVRDFDDGFPFWDASQIFLKERFDGIEITVTFVDPADTSQVFTFTGASDDLVSWIISSGLHMYLRKNYDKSPNYAVYEIVNTDDITNVEYDINVGVSVSTPSPTPTTPPITPPGKTKEEIEIELEKEKQKTAKDLAAVEKEKTKKLKEFNKASNGLKKDLEQGLISKTQYKKMMSMLLSKMEQGGLI